MGSFHVTARLSVAFLERGICRGIADKLCTISPNDKQICISRGEGSQSKRATAVPTQPRNGYVSTYWLYHVRNDPNADEVNMTLIIIGRN